MGMLSKRKATVVRRPLILKLITVFILVCIIPISVFSFYLLSSVSENSITLARNVHEATLAQLSQNIQNYLRGYVSYIEQLKYDQPLIDYLQDEHTLNYEHYLYYMTYIRPRLGWLTTQSNVRLRIYTPNETLNISGLMIRDAARFNEQRRMIEEAGTAIVWHPVKQVDGRSLIYLTTPIYDLPGDGPIVGILELGLDVNSISAFAVQESLRGSHVFLSDDRGQAVFGNGADDPPDGDSNLLYLQTGLSDTSVGIRNWSLGAYIPLRQIDRDVASIRTVSIGLAAGSALLAVLLITLMSQNITSRIGRLIHAMDDTIKTGDTSIHTDISGQDEIKLLAEYHNKMLQRLHHLHTEVYTARIKRERLQREQKEAQLLALQAQINPHYLFNTLESMRMNLLVSGDRRTANAIYHFAEGFRSIIDERVQFVSLEEELVLIRSYFEVQKYRFDKKFNLVVSVDPAKADIRIPKLLLQPLAENAFRHGIERKPGEGTVHIAIRQMDDRLELKVSDDGLGMPHEELENIRQALKQRDSFEGQQYYALRNIAKRLWLLYGAAGSIEIRSAQSEGTTVELNLPANMDAQLQEKEDGNA